MNLMCWNCRGMGNPWSVRRLRSWSNIYAPDLVFVSETMVSKAAAEQVKERIGYSSAVGVASTGRSGGLCLFWQEDRVNFDLISFSNHHICGDVKKRDLTWRFVGIFGWADASNKYRTWELIHQLCEEVTIPILLGGDFNEILSQDEKEGGSTREMREVENFRALMDRWSLRDLGFVGQWWTWERGKKVDTRVRERLDRYIASSSWVNMYPNATVEHLVRYNSDHSPILVKLKPDTTPKIWQSKTFKFETAWLFDESCEQVVREA